MIPVRLTLEGLYSYKDSQTIDFEHLICSGLFGVFGDTGSGKSTILEAITYALYGETERLNNRDNRAYNMMNLKSNRLYVEFDFRNHENTLYRATREVKRNQKNFDKVYSPTVVFYEQVNNNWVPLDHSDAESILGLSYNNFKRTIIIPQGQFKEFLELGPADRTRMMKEIFQLHRFDLQDNVRRLRNESQSKLDHLQGQLQSFEQVTKEQINEKNEIVETLKKTQTTTKKSYDEIHNKYQRVKALKQDFKELQNKQESFVAVEKQAVHFKDLQEKVKLFELVERTFTHLLKSEKEINEKHSDKIKKKQESQLKLGNNQKLLATAKESLEKIAEYHKNLSTKRAEEKDLENIAEILELQKEVDRLEERSRKGEQELSKVQNQIKSAQVDVEQKREEIAILEKNKIDDTLLFKVQDWFTTNKNILTSLKSKEGKLNEIQTKLLEHLKLLDENLEIGDDFQAIYRQRIKEIEEKNSLFTVEKNSKELQMRLVEHAHALHDGAACPLCGSLEHPNKLQSDVVDDDLKKLKADIESGQKRQQELFQINHTILTIESQFKDMRVELTATEKELQEHDEKFLWKEFDQHQPQSFQLELEKSLEINKTLKIKREESTQKDQQLHQLRENLEKYRKALDDINKAHLTKQTEIKTKNSNLTALIYADFQEWNAEKIREQQIQLIDANNLVEKKYDELIKEINQLNQNLAVLHTTVKSLTEDVKELESQFKENATQINQQLQSHEIEIEQVRDVLSWEMDVQTAREDIEHYKVTYQTLKKQIAALQQKLKDEQFDEASFLTLETLYNQKAEELKSANEEVIKAQTEIMRLQEELKLKLVIVTNLEREQKRFGNLKLMFNLFKSAGFVEYVSSIYLGQLCEIANTRFVRMTRNQLRLVLNDNYEFEIIDNLNEGRSRSVKTLSGGQAFQVSLSLALALAESVQTHAKSDKNFFFIDEGFGTQDSESIQIIFETLLHLNKENKVVGIISHVEELKENVPASLSIVKDPERGSLIY